MATICKYKKEDNTIRCTVSQEALPKYRSQIRTCLEQAEAKPKKNPMIGLQFPPRTKKGLKLAVYGTGGKDGFPQQTGVQAEEQEGKNGKKKITRIAVFLTPQRLEEELERLDREEERLKAQGLIPDGIRIWIREEEDGLHAGWKAESAEPIEIKIG